MNTQTAAERCQGLLAEMGQIEVIIPGKLCQRRGQKGKITGWKLQRWQKGRNETRYIPAGLTERIQEGTAGHQRFMALAHEYTEVKGEEALADLSAPSHAKKKPMKR